MLDSFDKGWFVFKRIQDTKIKLKKIFCNELKLITCLKISCVLKSQLKLSMLRKTVKLKKVEENRFPGYVLVEMVMTDEAWFVVRNTPNVTGFVGSHGNRSKPTPLLEEEIRQILISMGQTVDVFDTNIKVGDVVQIIDGAFMGQEGRVVEIENNKVKIMINMFGSETAAELELYQIAEL